MKRSRDYIRRPKSLTPMSRSRYYIDLNRPQSWQGKPWVTWLFAALGAAYVGVGIYLVVGGGQPPEEGANWMVLAQSVLFGSLMVFYSTGVGERYFGRFVDINLASVRWRLTDPEGVPHAAYHQLSLARVRDIRVGVLRIDFVMDDGAAHAMPLGELPYEAVREIKRRFEGQASLAGATGVAMGYVA